MKERKRRECRTGPVRGGETEGSGIARSHNSTPSFLHLSFGCSRSRMLSLHPSLPPLIHLLPALADSLFGPRSPVIHSACQSWQWHRDHNDSCFSAGPAVSTSVPPLKAQGFKSHESRVTELTPR